MFLEDRTNDSSRQSGSAPLETQLVFPMKSLLHRFEFFEIQGFEGFIGTYRKAEEFFEKLNFSNAKTFDTTFHAAFGFQFFGDGHGVTFRVRGWSRGYGKSSSR